MLMNTVFFASLLAVVLTQTPAPTCYGAGSAPSSACNQFINQFCNGMVSLRAGDNISRCYNLPGGDRCDFIAFNSIGSTSTPNVPNCKTILNNITGRCPYGGYGKISATANTFTVDRNSGPCSQNVQCGS
ncbi:hypothetical protein P691DRAFT_764958 [Macrolepiota fuliginosa MF-IS2]|uniref:Glycan binding protein Y3-like domain-containing protein n=1 Tax=Macrolepiota fuliginosa MF-IS2 TaxID=1400762 RepID=A0A9P5X1R3_9AGAR|nr:hypothetical protein P691DRAFT_764958 [Macrolepiota fuliginosa MF-IS2]